MMNGKRNQLKRSLITQQSQDTSKDDSTAWQL